METDTTKEIKMWQFKTFKVDKLRGETVSQVFPELEGMY